jgi:carbon monoxide dehydrogenase subunit G
MELSFKVNKPIETVFDYLTDMQKFVSVHPVISKMDNLSENNYLVHETLKLGFIPFSFTYPATVEQNFTDKKVLIRATVMKLTKIEMSYTLTKESGSTIISESIIFKSPLPVKSLMQRIFRKQHTILFKKIDDL